MAAGAAGGEERAIMFLTLKCGEFECQKGSLATAGCGELEDAMRGGWRFWNCPDGVPSCNEVTAARVSAALAGETLQWICPDCAALMECH